MRFCIGHAVPWWLYADDLDLAIHKQHELISKIPSGEQQLKAISVLSYLGDYEGCAHWLKRVDGIKHLLGQQSMFRILRHQRDANPWRALISEEKADSLIRIVDQRIKSGQPVLVDVVGGIGDQLESSAMLRCVKDNLSRSDGLWIRPMGENSGIVRQLLEEADELPLAPIEALDQAWRITAPWFRFWLGIKGIQEKIPLPLLMDRKQKDDNQRRRLLVCWRTKPDRGNPLSSFSRSLDFRTIRELYGRWESQIVERDLQVVDLSDYSASEIDSLPRNRGWLKLARGAVQNLQDTRRLIKTSDKVVTVDTSLGHLAVLCDRDVHILLPLFCDERWLSLLSEPGIYLKRVIPHHQSQFNDWRSTLTSLEDTLF